MRAWSSLWLALALLAPLLAPRVAAAGATFVVDAQGDGFDDPTRVAAVAGNPGLTLGDQRMAAVLHAADQWSALLGSKVPVIIEVRFADLGCDGTAAVLAHAGAAKLLRGVAGGDPDLWYPSALANKLAGVDLSPGEPDVVMELNSAVDGACRSALGGWYYGFDGARGSSVDLIETVLHELAHGLGFSSSIDPETGEAGLPSGTDVFSAHVLDLRTGKPWASLSAGERRLSSQAGRGLAFDGPRTQKGAAGMLQSGTDRQGRPLLYARTPIDRGSAVSHFDPSVQPDLLMEPFARKLPTHDVDLTLAVLGDLGWTGDCGNGRVDPGEECDEGGKNGSQPGASCRLSCRRARCGDGVVDPGEACDDGAMNSDAVSFGCTSTCAMRGCDPETKRALEEACAQDDDELACAASCSDVARRAGDAGTLATREPGTLTSVRREPGCALGATDDGAWAWLALGLLASRRRSRK